jgi:hypothetical protein
MWHFFDQFYFASVTTHFYIYNTDDADNADDTDDDADHTDDDADVRTWPITPTTVSSQRTLHSIISLSHQTSFLQSSTSGDRTLVVKNAIDTDASGLALFTK